MAGFIKSEAKRVETMALNQQINKKVLDECKDYCKTLGYPMNVLIETFMQQYVNGRFDLSSDEINKWKKDNSEKDTLNTTFNKEIYLNFKNACKGNGYFVKHVITAFMEKFASKKYIMEFVEVKDE